MSVKCEKTGGNVNYYVVEIPDPKRLEPYTAECEDIIEALEMTFAEGCAFKAIWRSCAARTLGKLKADMDQHGVYDAEKVQYYGGRMLAVRKRKATLGVPASHQDEDLLEKLYWDFDSERKKHPENERIGFKSFLRYYHSQMNNVPLTAIPSILETK